MSYNWKEDSELCLMLADSAPAPVIKERSFDSQYEICICKHKGQIELKKHIPGWAVPVVESMLDKDKNVKSYTIRRTYKGNIPDSVIVAE